MWNKIFMVLLSYFIQFKAVQSKIDVIFTNAETTFVNPEYISDFKFNVNGDNTGIFVNFTTIKYPPESTKLLYNQLTASMGQYVPTGAIIDMEMCNMFEPPYLMFGDSMKSFGISDDNCPPRPGIYGSKNFVLSSDNTPEAFPPNDYLAVLTVHAEDENILEIKLFFRVALQNPLKFG